MVGGLVPRGLGPGVCARGSQAPCLAPPPCPAPMCTTCLGEPCLDRELFRPRCAGCGHSYVPAGRGTVGWQSWHRVTALALGKQDVSGQETLPTATSRVICAGSAVAAQGWGPLGLRLGTGFVFSFFSS